MPNYRTYQRTRAYSLEDFFAPATVLEIRTLYGDHRDQERLYVTRDHGETWDAAVNRVKYEMPNTRPVRFMVEEHADSHDLTVANTPAGWFTVGVYPCTHYLAVRARESAVPERLRPSTEPGHATDILCRYCLDDGNHRLTGEMPTLYRYNDDQLGCPVAHDLRRSV